MPIDKRIRHRVVPYLIPQIQRYRQPKRGISNYHFHQFPQQTQQPTVTTQHEPKQLISSVICPLCKCKNQLQSNWRNFKMVPKLEECCICYDNISNVYFPNCGHICICSKCCEKLITVS